MAGSSATLLGSLSPALPSCLLALFSSEFGVSLEASPRTGMCFGRRQEGTPHWTPVKLFRVKLCLIHFLHGFPLRSRARNPAFIAP